MRQAWAASATNPDIRQAAQRQARILDGLATDWARGAMGGKPEVADRPELLALAARMLLDGAIADVAERHARGEAGAVARAAGSLLRRALRDDAD